MKVKFGVHEIEVGTMEQLDELVMRYGGKTVSMTVRTGALEIEADTVEGLGELFRRYGSKIVATAGSPTSEAPKLPLG
jgi:hypothetical protein